MKKALLIALLSVLQTSMPAHGIETMPPALQGVLIAKMLGFEKRIDQTAFRGMITVGILYDNSQNSKNDAENLATAFEKIRNSDVKIKQYSVNCTLLPLTTDLNLKNELREIHASVLCAFLSSKNAKTVIQITRELKVLSIACTDAEQNVFEGVSVGLGVEQGKSKILINTDSAGLEGREFTSSFLLLTTVVNK